MLSFTVYINGRKCGDLDLSGAYLVGTDDVPLRGELSLSGGVLTCRKRAAGAAGLVIPWEVRDVGCFLLETARLMERPKPYVLQLELVRGRLIRVFQKVEEWGLHETEQSSSFTPLQTKARELLLKGMLADTDSSAAGAGDKALQTCIQLSDDIVSVHAQTLLQRRRAARAVPRHAIGTVLPLDPASSAPLPASDGADFASLPLPWRLIEPQEQKPDFKLADEAFAWAATHKLGVRAGPLLSFGDGDLPEWLSSNGGDFGWLRDLAHEHIKRVLNRFAPRVLSWCAVGGINLGRGWPLSIDQIIELTRMAAATVKRLAPNAPVLVDIEDPWGEYHAVNARSIPPMLYAEMLLQCGVPVDGFGVRFAFGSSGGGRFLRDFFQISTLLDKLSGFNKPLHLTVAPGMSAVSGHGSSQAGWWHEPWSEATVGAWLQNFLELSLSKPVVESVSVDLRGDGGRESAAPGREPIMKGLASTMKAFALSLRPPQNAASRDPRDRASQG